MRGGGGRERGRGGGDGERGADGCGERGVVMGRGVVRGGGESEGGIWVSEG